LGCLQLLLLMLLCLLLHVAACCRGVVQGEQHEAARWAHQQVLEQQMLGAQQGQRRLQE
jgi:hypothetical protein